VGGTRPREIFAGKNDKKAIKTKKIVSKPLLHPGDRGPSPGGMGQKQNQLKKSLRKKPSLLQTQGVSGGEMGTYKNKRCMGVRGEPYLFFFFLFLFSLFSLAETGPHWGHFDNAGPGF